MVGEAQALTPSKERIARLAGEGLTNNEIAARLSISPKTVEASLGRAYQKVGISRRAELGRWAAEQRSEGGTRDTARGPSAQGNPRCHRGLRRPTLWT